jgi:dTDP-D-glucose 4,6-dehydratase
LLRVDLTDTEATAAAVRQADPELVTHLGAKSHMDRSIVGPASLIVAGEQLACECQIGLLLGNISTNEVY